MKIWHLLLQVLVLLLGLVVTAPAVTIQTPRKACHQEENLYQIITTWGFPVDNATLQHATPLESLPAGTYVITHYASYADKPALIGTYPLEDTAPARNAEPPAGAINLLSLKKSDEGTGNITFSEGTDFGFFADLKKKDILLTTQNQNSATRPYHQSSSLIFDLGAINPQDAGQYLIAFEQGRNRHHPYGDLDYNDLVVCVTLVPVPATLPLLGGGLLGLWLLGFTQRPPPTPMPLPGHHPPGRGRPA